jgi:hypothetical protein
MSLYKFPLGAKIKDKISGFKGVCTGRLEFLNGCKRYQISPEKLDAGKVIEAIWFDEEQVELISNKNNFIQKPVGGDYPAPRMKKDPKF